MLATWKIKSRGEDPCGEIGKETRRDTDKENGGLKRPTKYSFSKWIDAKRSGSRKRLFNLEGKERVKSRKVGQILGLLDFGHIFAGASRNVEWWGGEGEIKPQGVRESSKKRTTRKRGKVVRERGSNQDLC